MIQLGYTMPNWAGVGEKEVGPTTNTGDLVDSI